MTKRFARSENVCSNRIPLIRRCLGAGKQTNGIASFVSIRIGSSIFGANNDASFHSLAAPMSNSTLPSKLCVQTDGYCRRIYLQYFLSSYLQLFIVGNDFYNILPVLVIPYV